MVLIIRNALHAIAVAIAGRDQHSDEEVAIGLNTLRIMPTEPNTIRTRRSQ
jgi:hypothetical protein